MIAKSTSGSSTAMGEYDASESLHFLPYVPNPDSPGNGPSGTVTTPDTSAAWGRSQLTVSTEEIRFPVGSSAKQSPTLLSRALTV
ncbi:MAG: hypothetical protein JWP83_3738 [Mycobacterium sp.]|nr:hypothetical protein [Mycobacterium sp.]